MFFAELLQTFVGIGFAAEHIGHDTEYFHALNEMINTEPDKSSYTIVTNINRRKILVINDVVDIDHTPEITWSNCKEPYSRSSCRVQARS